MNSMENLSGFNPIMKKQSPPQHLGELLPLQIDFFTKLRRMGRSTNTLKNYKTDLDCFNNYLRDQTGKLDISNFLTPQMKEYGEFLQQKYNSDNSRRRRIQALRIFFDYLLEQGLIQENPVRTLPTSPKFLDIPRPTPLIDVKTLWVYLLEETQSSNSMSALLAKRNQVTLLLVFGAGLKVSDLAHLHKDCIMLDNAPRVMVHHAKRDPYTIPLPNVFITIYEEYLLALDEMKRKSGLDFDEVLFNANPYRILSGGLSPRGLEIIFEEFRKKLMLTLTPKSLRQACIFKWLHQNVKDTTVKEWMGVAPSYGLKLYKEHLDQHIYNEEFLEELFENNRHKSGFISRQLS
jgi:site-specific recombinase XerD